MDRRVGLGLGFVAGGLLVPRPRWRRTLRRCVSVSAPHTPNCCRVPSAHAWHAATTGHRRQTARACWTDAFPVAVASLAKKSSASSWRQAAWSRPSGARRALGADSLWWVLYRRTRGAGKEV